jgi:hypothetical protein
VHQRRHREPAQAAVGAARPGIEAFGS